MDYKLTAYMVDDFLHDPCLAARVVFGANLTPRDELRLWAMWTKNFMIDNSALGQGKGFCIAIVSALRAILMKDRTELLVSLTLRQAQLIHKHHWDWVRTCPIFKNEFRLNREGKPDMKQTSDFWEDIYKSGSIVRIVPIGFATRGEGIASEDATDLYADEVTKYPDKQVFWQQVFGRARRPVPKAYDDFKIGRLRRSDPIFGQHRFMSGTPKFTWDPLFKTVQEYQQACQPEHEQYWHKDWVSFNYQDLQPFFADHPEWEEYVGVDTMHEMERELPHDRVMQEVLGYWVTDSSSYYSSEDIQSARNPAVPILLEREDVA